MGTVYEAEHILLGRKVAVKVMHPEYVSRPESVERFSGRPRPPAPSGIQT